MAEEVQGVLDRMVPALNDLQERGVFTKEEIHTIVDRRRLSEYATRRRQPRKADFLRYLQQEMDLEKLRKIRVQRIAREESRKSRQANQDHERSRHIGDQHIVSYLHILWKRTLQKYKSDVSLYIQYAAFCKEVHAQRTLSRVYGEALRMHPNQVDLWIEAASHEFFEAGSIQNARVLMQRALRIHPKAENLWVQLFALELHFATKMMGRRKILQGDDAPEVENNDSHDPFAIAALVFKNAIAKIPHDVHFQTRFWDQCRLFPRTEPIKRIVWQSVVKECGEKPEAWLAWALFAWQGEQDSKRNEKKKKKRTKQDDADNGETGEERGLGFLCSETVEDEAEPSQKKLKAEDGTFVANTFDKESMLSVLRRAVDTIRTEEMFLKAARAINKHIEELKTLNTSDADIDASIKFLGEILTEASKESFYSANLAVEYAIFLTRCGNREDAKKCLQEFIDSNGTETPAHLWVHLAKLSGHEADNILENASRHITVDKKEHFHILLRLLGAKMQKEDETDTIRRLFERIILLAPGFKNSLVLEHESFGISGLADATLQFLNYTRDRQGTEAAQKVYQAFLYKSTVAKALMDADPDTTISLFSTAADVARLAYREKNRKTDLKRLYDAIISVLGSSSIADDFRQQKREDLASSSLPQKVSVPKLDAQAHNFSASTLSQLFEKYKVAHLSNVRRVTKDDMLSWKDISKLYSNLNSSDRESWCVETDQGVERIGITPDTFLAPKRTHHRAYCSFLVQKDLECYKKTESMLPVTEIPCVQWSYESALWVFFGRNPLGSQDLQGRPEHTDSISADGTWHFQLSGVKKWTIRPSDDLIKHMSIVLDASDFQRWRASSGVEVTCRQGDVLIINTRLWFHQTHIPPQPTPSVSYARDFWRESSAEVTGTMSNVDGTYATNDIEERVIIFTEDTLPDGELFRSDDPNCELVELEDGKQAIVSARSIKSGEFLSIARSDDEDSDGEDEEEEEIEE